MLVFFRWSFGQLVFWSIGQLVSWSVIQFNNLVGRLIGHGQQICRSFIQLICCSVGQWSLGQLVSSSVCLLACNFVAAVLDWSATWKVI
jgi:hypothetical protein